MKTVYNPAPEALEVRHNGVAYALAPDDFTALEDDVADHAVIKLGARGVMAVARHHDHLNPEDNQQLAMLKAEAESRHAAWLKTAAARRVEAERVRLVVTGRA